MIIDIYIYKIIILIYVKNDNQKVIAFKEQGIVVIHDDEWYGTPQYRIVFPIEIIKSSIIL